MSKRKTLYEEIDHFDQMRNADLIRRITMNENTDELDAILQTCVDKILKTKTMSNRFKTMMERVIKDKSPSSRVAKHACFFFYLFTDEELAKSLLTSPPKVDPAKFKLFYEKYLPPSFFAVLRTNITTLQGFGEQVRYDYERL
tara:strand:- start:171 stop:599 length:429 start_codon:yes stop_codon:yes gene_type:complete